MKKAGSDPRLPTMVPLGKAAKIGEKGGTAVLPGSAQRERKGETEFLIAAGKKGL